MKHLRDDWTDPQINLFTVEKRAHPMPDRPIIGEDAKRYLKYVSNHGLQDDTAWLIDVGRFPVSCRVLDVGCGSGALVAALAGDKQFARSVIGVESSPDLANHARQIAVAAGGMVSHGDFSSWTPPIGWLPDTMVMSFFLHHTEDIEQHLQRAASLLPHGGRLYIFDRIALDDASLQLFPSYWKERYRAAHEWHEEMPRLMSVAGLTAAAQDAGFTYVGKRVCPHDHRPGAERFPKTLMEFWRHRPGGLFPGVLLVSPAHQSCVDSIRDRLASANLIVSREVKIQYSNDLIRTIYERCPWREHLLQFVEERCSNRNATALQILGDESCPKLLERLSRFKNTERDRWTKIAGPTKPDGFQAIILPFHVAEPYESETLARIVGLAGEGHSK